MTLRSKLGSGIESLEMRAAPSTLLGTGIALGSELQSEFAVRALAAKRVESAFVATITPGAGGQSSGSSPSEFLAKPQTLLDAVFAGRSAARNAFSDSTGHHAGAKAVAKDTADVLNFPTGDNVIEGASSTLRRTPNGISWTLKTNELQAGHAYSLWVVAFNNPDACENGCGLDDLFRPDVQTTLAYGGGHVVGPSGSATFSGHLQEGDTSGFPLDSPFVGIPGQHLGLVDAATAEIHLVVRDHGEVIPGRVSEQIGTFSGACDENACANVQFAAHHA